MEIITVDKSNIETEHICCAITDKKGETRVSLKKAWLKEAFEDGLVFKKLDVRGKVFIEYIPAENAWSPIEANGYMYINCFWVSGKYAKHGYGSQLLDECIVDAKQKGKAGLVVLSSKKKMPFLSDPKFLKAKGFKVADVANPYFELLYLPFDEDCLIPKFKSCAKQGVINDEGIVVYYTNQCPHAQMYVELVEQIAVERKVEFKQIKITSKEAAQNAPSPFTTYSFFNNKTFVTNEIFSEKKFVKYLDSL